MRGKKTWETWETPGKHLGKTRKNDGKKVGTPGRTEENLGNTWEKLGKKMEKVGKPGRTQENLGNTLGKTWKLDWNWVSSSAEVERLSSKF